MTSKEILKEIATTTLVFFDAAAEQADAALRTSRPAIANALAAALPRVPQRASD